MIAYLNCLLLHFIMIIRSYILLRVLVSTLLVLVILLPTSILFGQNNNNPFEIKNRINTPPTNPSAAEILSDTSFVPLDTIKSADYYTSTPTSQESNNQSGFKIKPSSKNPFEVNHIPLRRKDIKSKSQDKTPQPSGSEVNIQRSKAFIYWLTVVSLVLLVLASSASKNLISTTTKSIFNENILKLNRRTNSNIALGSILLYLIFLINSGIFLMLLWTHYGSGSLSFTTFLKCSSLIAIIYTVRHITLYLFGSIFPLQKESSLYSYTIQVFNAFIGVVLIPINLFLAFGPPNIQSIILLFGLSILSILLIIRYMRGVTISINYIFNNLILFFIYLCILEIAPILLLVKVFSKY